MTAFYNELDPYAARWLRNLSDAKHINPGTVDDRSIRDLQPADVARYRQAHFFAGIGVWSYALRLAGVPDDANVWTGSCPCQPFSGAGKRGGFDDDRHLWPEWFRLIRECRPAIIFGEQVASPDGLKWFDVVSADLENEGYSVGAADLCAASVGAPHIRQRLFFVAFSGEQRCEGFGVHLQPRQPRSTGAETVGSGAVGELAHHHPGLEGRVELRNGTDQRAIGSGGVVGKLGNPGGGGGGRDTGAVSGPEGEGASEGGTTGGVTDLAVPAGATNNWVNGYWRNAEWIQCRDGKARPVEPGTFPLVDGAPGRVGRLRAYGNAIVAQVAATFVTAALGGAP